MTTLASDKPDFVGLGDGGLKWVRECLGNGEEFSKLVLSTINLDNGKVYLDIAIQEIRVAFENQIPLNQHVIVHDSAENTELLVRALFNKLQQLENNHGPLTLVDVDNTVEFRNKANHNYVSGLPHYQFNKVWLYVQKISNIQRWQDIEAFELTVGYPDSTFIIPQKALPSNKHGNSKLSEKDVKDMAASVLGIINGAYHAYANDSYTIWLSDKLDK